MSGAPQDYTQRCVGIERVSHEVNRIIAGERLAQYGWRGGADFPTRWKTPMPCLPPSNQPGLIARGAVFSEYPLCSVSPITFYQCAHTAYGYENHAGRLTISERLVICSNRNAELKMLRIPIHPLRGM